MFGLGRRELIIIAIIIAAVVFGTGYRLAGMKSVLDEETSFVVNEKNEEAENKPAGDKAAGENKDEGEQFVVHVTGAVKKPGVYRLPAGSRVVDALNLAGPAAWADLEQLNLAAEIEDGEQIPVPRKGATADNTASGGGASAAGHGSGKSAAGGSAAGSVSGVRAKVNPGGGKVNLNKAGEAELDTLPGIGPALAARIVEYRENQGKFKDASELKNVSGIGEKKFNDLAGLVTVK